MCRALGNEVSDRCRQSAMRTHPVLLALALRPLARREALVLEVVLPVVLEPDVIQCLTLEPFATD